MKIYSTPNLMGNHIKNPATYSSEDINSLFDLTDEEAVELTKVISNQVAINKVYSSQKTEERLTEILTEANEFAIEHLGKSNFLSIDIVTSVDEIVDEHILYLIADESGNNTYNQYVLIDGVAKSLGSTQCELTNYVTNDKLDEKLEDYAKKNEVFSANNIITTIDDAVTNDQVFGALTIKEHLNEIKNNITNSVNKEEELETAIDGCEEQIDNINKNILKCMMVRTFPSSGNIYECTSTGIYLTNPNNVNDLPTGWSQGRHIVVTFNPDNDFYGFQIIATYPGKLGTGNNRKLAIRHSIISSSYWIEISNREKTAISLEAGEGYTIVSQNCYEENGKTYINALFKTTDDSVFPNGPLYIGASNQLPIGSFAGSCIAYSNITDNTPSDRISTPLSVCLINKNISVLNTISNLKALNVNIVCS